MLVVAAALLSAPADREMQRDPTPLSAPASWFGPDDYPPAAIRAHQQGRVRFAIDVSALGAVTGCRIVESSGSADLDGQTCALAMRNGRFSPATTA